MQPIWYLIGASAASAVAALGSVYVAIMGDRARREREARADLRAMIVASAPSARDRFVVTVWNEGDGTAYDVSVSAQMASPDEDSSESVDVSLGEDSQQLPPGNSRHGRVDFPKVVHRSLITLHWQEQCKYLLCTKRVSRERRLTLPTNVRQ